jgi:hypothetical protein
VAALTTFFACCLMIRLAFGSLTYHVESRTCLDWDFRSLRCGFV